MRKFIFLLCSLLCINQQSKPLFDQNPTFQKLSERATALLPSVITACGTLLLYKIGIDYHAYKFSDQFTKRWWQTAKLVIEETNKKQAKEVVKTEEKVDNFTYAYSDKTFADVAGLEDAKEELKDLVEFLKNPEKMTRLGARIPHGILLHGSPGNGKTLLVKALAGEADCPFINVSGSEFVQLFVGAGAKRVRELFEQARSLQRCVIFIDEFDALAVNRKSLYGNDSEYRQTVNQLLTELDGFANNEGIVVLAATNALPLLDDAVIRPGRFDKKIYISHPMLDERKMILHVHLRTIQANDSINLDTLATMTYGFSGADLANLVNEAAHIATKLDACAVNMNHFLEAYDQIIIGKTNKSVQKIATQKDKEITAWHEAGHALMRVLQPEAVPLDRVTILPRGHALGVTLGVHGEKLNQTKKEILAEIRVALAGSIAEELFLGDVTTGASSDFEKASRLALNMVFNFGMSELGSFVIDAHTNAQQTVARGDRLAQKILEQCKIETENLLKQEYVLLEKLAQELLKKETLTNSQVCQLLAQERA